MPATLTTTNDPRPRVAVLDPPALAGQATRIYVLATALAAAAFAALAIDIPASEFCRSLVHDGPGDFHKALQLFEAFAHGVGIAIIVAIIATLDGWKNAVRIAACAYGAGLANLLVKLSIGRSRPQVFWRMGEWPEQVSETFVGLVLFGDSSQAMSRGIQSFPSDMRRRRPHSPRRWRGIIRAAAGPSRSSRR
jgi:hypothetical protein